MQSTANTVEEYLATLSPERRNALEAIRRVILKNLPSGYEEVMNWGMISYQVPLSTYPDTYNKQPLAYAALASQKNNMALYLMNIYADERLRAAFEAGYAAVGKKPNMGKSCIRFTKLEDLSLEAVAMAIAATPVDTYVAQAKAALSARKK